MSSSAALSSSTTSAENSLYLDQNNHPGTRSSHGITNLFQERGFGSVIEKGASFKKFIKSVKIISDKKNTPLLKFKEFGSQSKTLSSSLTHLSRSIMDLKRKSENFLQILADQKCSVSEAYAFLQLCFKNLNTERVALSPRVQKELKNLKKDDDLLKETWR